LHFEIALTIAEEFLQTNLTFFSNKYTLRFYAK